MVKQEGVKRHMVEKKKVGWGKEIKNEGGGRWEGWGRQKNGDYDIPILQLPFKKRNCAHVAKLQIKSASPPITWTLTHHSALCCLGLIYLCECVPVVRVVGLRSAPPDIRIIRILLSTIGVTLRLSGAAHKLHSSEAVDATRQQHPIVVEVHGAVSAGLRRDKADQYMLVQVIKGGCVVCASVYTPLWLQCASAGGSHTDPCAPGAGTCTYQEQAEHRSQILPLRQKTYTHLDLTHNRNLVSDWLQTNFNKHWFIS